MARALIVDKPLVCQRGLPGRLSSHCSSIQHGRPTPSHRPALTLARCSAPADFASLRVLGAPAASRPSISHRSTLRLRGVPRLRTALRFACAVFRVCGALRAVLDASALRAFDCALRFAPCARHVSPSGLRRLRPVSRTARGLRSSHRPALRWPGIPGLRSTSCCPRPSTPSGLRRLRPVSRIARGLRSSHRTRLRRRGVLGLRMLRI